MATTSTFSEWFDSVFKEPDESREHAISRFQTELSREHQTSIGFQTIYYALRGARMKPETARKVELFTKGAVSASSLVMAPTRSEVRAGGAEDAEEPKPRDDSDAQEAHAVAGEG